MMKNNRKMLPIVEYCYRSVSGALIFVIYALFDCLLYFKSASTKNTRHKNTHYLSKNRNLYLQRNNQLNKCKQNNTTTTAKSDLRSSTSFYFILPDLPIVPWSTMPYPALPYLTLPYRLF